MTKVIVANDLVGLGKVALTSSLPIMSACQTEVLPYQQFFIFRIQGSLKISMHGILRMT